MAHKLSVLHIDDDPYDRMLVASALRRSGSAPVSLHQSADVSGAEDCISRFAVDAILLDARRPDCESLTKDIARLHAHCGAPVLVLSALDRDLLESETITAGGDGVLSKTNMTSAALVTAIQDAVARYRLRSRRDEPPRVPVELATLRPLLADMAERVSRLRRAFSQLFVEVDIGDVNTSVAELCFDVFHHQQGDADMALALSRIADAMDARAHDDQPAPLRTAINRACSTAWPWSSDANVTIVYGECPDVSVPDVSMADLTTALSALLSAQCFFSESGADVTISAQLAGDIVRVAVASEAGGVPQWLLETPLKPTPGADAALPALQALAALSKVLMSRLDIAPSWAALGGGVSVGLKLPAKKTV